jgi:MFS transporter, DHA2 family, multidrug resistance protein
MTTATLETLSYAAAVEHPRATYREWGGLAVIALPCMLYSMDLTVLDLAVPQLTADLRPTSSQLLWILDIYSFLIAGSLITMGTLATGSAAGSSCSSARPPSA